MAEQINYCDQCGHMILPSEVHSGEVLVSSAGVMCKTCLLKLPKHQRDSLTAKVAPRKTPRPVSSSAMHRQHTTRHEPIVLPNEGGGRATLAVAVVGVFAGMLVTAAVSLMLTNPPDERVAVAQPVAHPRVPPVAVPSETGKWKSPDVAQLDEVEGPVNALSEEIEQIEKMVDPSLGKYPDIVRRLNALLAVSRESPIAARAEALLDRTKREYSALAKEAFILALDSARDLKARDRKSDAAAVLRSVAARYGDSEWYLGAGRQELDAAIAGLTEIVTEPVAVPPEQPVAKQLAAAPPAPRGEAEPIDPIADRREERSSEVERVVAVPPAGEDITDGLLAYFKLDEGKGSEVYDEAGTGAFRDEGTLQCNGAEGTHWRWAEGKFGKALGFTPDRSLGMGREVYGYIGLADGEIRWVHRKSYSLAAWVRFDDPPSKNVTGGLVRAAGYVAGLAYLIVDGSYRFEFGMSFDGDRTMAIATDTRPRREGVWYHVAGVLDTQTRKVKLYVDGVLSDEKDFPDPGTDLSGGPNGWHFGAGQPGTPWNSPAAAVLDEIRFYQRPLRPDEVAELYSRMDKTINAIAATREERRLFMREGDANVESDGYFIDLKTMFNLARTYDAERVKAKSVADMGGSTAASRSFGSAIAEALAREDGYVLVPPVQFAGSSVTTSRAKNGLKSRLSRVKPELLRIAFGHQELAKGVPVAKMRENLSGIVKQILDHGSVPVLFTLMIRKPVDAQALELLQSYNEAVRSLAAEAQVPCVDAYSILNRPGAGENDDYFARSGGPSREGFQAVNVRFLKLYRVLEHWVMGKRGLASALETAEAAEGAGVVDERASDGADAP